MFKVFRVLYSFYSILLNILLNSHLFYCTIEKNWKNFDAFSGLFLKNKKTLILLNPAQIKNKNREAFTLCTRTRRRFCSGGSKNDVKFPTKEFPKRGDAWLQGNCHVFPGCRRV